MSTDVRPRRRKLRVAELYEGVGYEPHLGQRKFHASRARFKVVDAGRRWGKSKSGPHEYVPRMFLREPVKGWIVAPTYDLGEKEFRVFWDVLVDKMQVPLDKSKTFNSIRTKDFRITTAWGSSIEVRSAEHPESLVGEGLDFVIMAEAAKLKLSHWEKYIRPTLADRRGGAIFVSTPEGYNWFYDLYKRGQDSAFEDWFSIKSPSWENHIIFPGGRNDPEILEAEAISAREVFDQEWGAEFTSFAGRIYSEFDEGYHVIDEDDFQFNPSWQNFVAFDFGFRNPFVCLNIQVDPEDNVYVWEEYYERNIHVAEHARRLKSMIQWRVDGGYYDPSGADPAQTISTIWQDSREYKNRFVEDVMLNPAPNDWEPGVNRVKEWLKLREHPLTKEEKPKLFVVSNCKHTIHEFNTYRVKEATEKMREARDPKEEPRKKDDHAMDALRYFLVGHFGFESHMGYNEDGPRPELQKVGSDEYW